MSDPFDPIENWLSTDVELMPPPAGAFDVVHRRARRRKAAVAAMTAAGAAVLIAAAVTVPQLASSLLPSHGGGPYKVGSSSSSSQNPSPSPGRSVRTPPVQPGRSSSAPPDGAGLSILSSSVAPAARFEPTSITFVNDAVGAVLGQTTADCPAVVCTTLAGTLDYGRTWTKVDAPPAMPPSGRLGVSQVRFLNGSDGWAYGPELYATHDGGATWTKITGLNGRVIDLATVGNQAYAVVAGCTGSGSDFSAGCSRFALYSTPFDADTWQPVAGASGRQPVRPGALQITSQYGYLLAGSTLFAGSPSGGAWQKVTPASGLVPACLRGGSGPPGLLAPGANSDLYLLCPSATGAHGTLYASIDAGQTWQKAGPFTGSGTVSSLAVAPTSGTLVAATSTGIFYSAGSSGQRTWLKAGLRNSAPAGGFSFVGMTTTALGVAVPAIAGPQEIFITRDGGLHWVAQAIS